MESFFKYALKIFCVFFIAVACSSEDEICSEFESCKNEHAVCMRLRSSIISFDGKLTRAGESERVWKDGEVIFLQFHTRDDAIVRGYASYNKSEDSWEVTYFGALSEEGTCEVYFFEGASTENKLNVELSEYNAIYADKAGIYYKVGEDLEVSAKLAPLTGRVCFKGIGENSIQVSTLSRYLSYNADKNLFSTSVSTVSLMTNSDGVSPYVYCAFANPSDPTLTLVNGQEANNISFIKTFDSSVLQVGKSGYIIIPTQSENKGWNVRVSVTAISLNKMSLSLDKGKTESLTATISPSNATDKEVLWTSSNSSVATVDENGKVTAVDKGSATITATSKMDGSKKVTCEVTVTLCENGHEYVDLGLPSGTLWATMNIGATSPEDYGDYFAWGETKTKYTYMIWNYNYSETPSTLPLDKDAANVNWGGNWRMPTQAELKELLAYSIKTWTTRNGVKGYEVKSFINGNSIFLPAAGDCSNGNVNGLDDYGCYWSSSAEGSDNAYYLYFYSGYQHVGNGPRFYGYCVRAVLAK